MLNLKWLRKLQQSCLKTLLVSCCLLGVAQAQSKLIGIESANLPNNDQEIRFHFSGKAPIPAHFSTQSPARVVLDFPSAKNGLAEKLRSFNNALVQNVTVVGAQGKLRGTIQLQRSVAYVVRAEANDVVVKFSAQEGSLNPTIAQDWSALGEKSSATSATRDIDFRRSANGGGVIEIMLPSANATVQIAEAAKKLTATISGMQWAAAQEKRLDVTDFGTPVRFVEAANRKGLAQVSIDMQSGFEYLAYQTGNRYVIDIKPQRKNTVAGGGAKKPGDKKEFKGELLSLNFQDIEVRAVLQVIADFTNLNIVVSDAVQGNVTVRLQNVPWDQALDIVLRTKGLGSRQDGNVIYIAPQEEFTKFEQLEPLVSTTVQINYAKAEDLAKVLQDQRNTGSDTAISASAALSPRGSLSVDPRTNTILVQDTADKLDGIRQLIAVLDQPIRQVMIDSRIVIANDTFGKALGVKWGVAGSIGSNAAIAGTLTGADKIAGSLTGNPNASLVKPVLADRLGVNLGVGAPTSTIGLAILGSNFLVDMELSALQSSGKGEVLSNPRVLTSDRQTAIIKQGQEIPYQKSDGDGNTTTEFKEVVLELNVTPQITPDDKIIMDINIKKDNVSGQAVDGQPVIDKREVKTQALVANGETVVLGGVYEQVTQNTVEKVPFLGSIPALGRLFKKDVNSNSRLELLIFVTPQIVKTTSSVNAIVR